MVLKKTILHYVVRSFINGNFYKWSDNGENPIFYNENHNSALKIHKKSDPKYYKRKKVAGSSYLYQLVNVFSHASYYAFEGYRHIGFRIIKEEISEDEPTEVQKPILKHWGIYE